MELVFCQIAVNGVLGPELGHWFEDMELRTTSAGNTLLIGTLPDDAAVYGLLSRIRSLGLTLISIHCHQPGTGRPPDSV